MASQGATEPSWAPGTTKEVLGFTIDCLGFKDFLGFLYSFSIDFLGFLLGFLPGFRFAFDSI